jgi:Protein of unknown function (DUF664)
MAELDEHGRPEPPLAADETATLLGFLDYQRATLAWKCGGLDAAGLQATAAASSITLGGLLKHLAYVESDWFSRWLHGRDRQPPWDTEDWKADPDREWHSAAEDSPEQLHSLWQEAVARSLVAEALAEGGLERLAPAHLAQRRGTQPAMDPASHDRGVRATQRPCQSHPGVGRRAHRGVAAGRTARRSRPLLDDVSPIDPARGAVIRPPR